MLLQFAAGLGLGLAVEHRRLPGRLAGTALIAGGLGLWVLEGALGVFTELWRPLLWGVPAFLVVAGVLSLETGGGLARLPRPLKRGFEVTGEASYAIYLLHLPATALIAHSLGWAHPWLFAPASLVASILAGLAGRAYIERPLLLALRRRFRAI